MGESKCFRCKYSGVCEYSMKGIGCGHDIKFAFREEEPVEKAKYDAVTEAQDAEIKSLESKLSHTQAKLEREEQRLLEAVEALERIKNNPAKNWVDDLVTDTLKSITDNTQSEEVKEV